MSSSELMGTVWLHPQEEYLGVRVHLAPELLG